MKHIPSDRPVLVSVCMASEQRRGEKLATFLQNQPEPPTMEDCLDLFTQVLVSLLDWARLNQIKEMSLRAEIFGTCFPQVLESRAWMGVDTQLRACKEFTPLLWAQPVPHSNKDCLDLFSKVTMTPTYWTCSHSSDKISDYTQPEPVVVLLLKDLELETLTETQWCGCWVVAT